MPTYMGQSVSEDYLASLVRAYRAGQEQRNAEAEEEREDPLDAKRILAENEDIVKELEENQVQVVDFARELGAQKSGGTEQPHRERERDKGKTKNDRTRTADEPPSSAAQTGRHAS